MPLGTCTMRCISASNVNARINDAADTDKKGVLNLVCKTDDGLASSAFVLDDVAQSFSCTTAPAIIRGVQGNGDENSGISKGDLNSLGNELSPGNDTDYINGKKLFPRLTYFWNPSLVTYNWGLNSNIQSNMSGSVDYSATGIYSGTADTSGVPPHTTTGNNTFAFYQPQLTINTNTFYIEFECVVPGNSATVNDFDPLFLITSQASYDAIDNNAAGDQWAVWDQNFGLLNNGSIIWKCNTGTGQRTLRWEAHLSEAAENFNIFPPGAWPGGADAWIKPGLIVQIGIHYDPALDQTEHIIQIVMVYNGVIKVMDHFTAGNKTSNGGQDHDTDVFLADDSFALPAIDDLRFGMSLGICGTEAPEWRIPLVKSVQYYGNMFSSGSTTPWLVN